MNDKILKLLNSPVMEDRMIGIELAGFTSKNGIPMIRGDKYNWQLQYKYRDKAGPISLFIYLGSMAEYCQVMWHLFEGDSIVFSQTKGGIALNCEGLEMAELMVESYVKANKVDLKGTIYER